MSTIGTYENIRGFLEGIRDVHNILEMPPPETIGNARKVGRITTVGAYATASVASLAIFWPIAIVPAGYWVIQPLVHT